MSKLRALVLSDLHVVKSASESPRHFASIDTDGQPGKNALTDLVHLIKSERITADFVICCGDITDKTIPESLSYAWKKLQDIRKLAKAKKLITTVGNHDVDSRQLKCSYDPVRNIKLLSPKIPFGDKGTANQYWTDHCSFYKWNDYLIVSLNTCAYHGAGEAEYERGRIDSTTINLIKEKSRDTKLKAKILILHHHPVPFFIPTSSELRADNEGVIGGEALIKELSGTIGSDWLIIHGHRHFPNIMYSYGGMCTPTIFSCGSFSSRLYDDIASIATNQFYIIDIEQSIYGHSIGKYQAWSYNFMSGWSLAGRKGIPSKGGFGFRGNLHEVAKNLAKAMKARKHCTWEAVTKGYEIVHFLIPDDLDVLSRILRKDHMLDIVRDESHSPIAIEVRRER